MIQNWIDPVEFASFLVRVLAGLLFFFQGYDKVFRIGIQGVTEAIGPSYKRAGLPDFVVAMISFLTSWIEFLGGFCLILGLFKYTMVYLLGIDLLIVAAGMSMIDPVWDLKLLFPRVILLLFLLLMPAESDILSLDHLIF
ncbi:MAG: DoxX family membrane protein [Bacteroidia bacterium]|nr:DoxX family membrane protein [Bacteroidia bacterium]